MGALDGLHCAKPAATEFTVPAALPLVLMPGDERGALTFVTFTVCVFPATAGSGTFHRRRNCGCEQSHTVTKLASDEFPHGLFWLSGEAELPASRGWSWNEYCCSPAVCIVASNVSVARYLLGQSAHDISPPVEWNVPRGAGVCWHFTGGAGSSG